MNNIKLENNILDSIDMNILVSKLDAYHEYFILPSGQEHYRLLRYLSSKINGNIVELGTHAGTSAIALSADTDYQILTYDIADVKHRDYADETNIIFRITDYKEDKDYESFILNSKMIFIDAPHDGAFEIDCYTWLKEKNYKGLTVWDDIHLNSEMVRFWSNVDLPKQDISKYGHITGTGVIFFGNDVEFEMK